MWQQKGWMASMAIWTILAIGLAQEQTIANPTVLKSFKNQSHKTNESHISHTVTNTEKSSINTTIKKSVNDTKFQWDHNSNKQSDHKIALPDSNSNSVSDISSTSRNNVSIGVLSNAKIAELENGFEFSETYLETTKQQFDQRPSENKTRIMGPNDNIATSTDVINIDESIVIETTMEMKNGNSHEILSPRAKSSFESKFGRETELKSEGFHQQQLGVSEVNKAKIATFQESDHKRQSGYSPKKFENCSKSTSNNNDVESTLGGTYFESTSDDPHLRTIPDDIQLGDTFDNPRTKSTSDDPHSESSLDDLDLDSTSENPHIVSTLDALGSNTVSDDSYLRSILNTHVESTPDHTQIKHSSDNSHLMITSNKPHIENASHDPHLEKTSDGTKVLGRSLKVGSAFGDSGSPLDESHFGITLEDSYMESTLDDSESVSTSKISHIELTLDDPSSRSTSDDSYSENTSSDTHSERTSNQTHAGSKSNSLHMKSTSTNLHIRNTLNDRRIKSTQNDPQLESTSSFPHLENTPINRYSESIYDDLYPKSTFDDSMEMTDTISMKPTESKNFSQNDKSTTPGSQLTKESSNHSFNSIKSTKDTPLIIESIGNLLSEKYSNVSQQFNLMKNSFPKKTDSPKKVIGKLKINANEKIGNIGRKGINNGPMMGLAPANYGFDTGAEKFNKEIEKNTIFLVGNQREELLPLADDAPKNGSTEPYDVIVADETNVFSNENKTDENVAPGNVPIDGIGNTYRSPEESVPINGIADTIVPEKDNVSSGRNEPDENMAPGKVLIDEIGYTHISPGTGVTMNAIANPSIPFPPRFSKSREILNSFAEDFEVNDTTEDTGIVELDGVSFPNKSEDVFNQSSLQTDHMVSEEISTWEIETNTSELDENIHSRKVHVDDIGITHPQTATSSFLDYSNSSVRNFEANHATEATVKFGETSFQIQSRKTSNNLTASIVRIQNEGSTTMVTENVATDPLVKSLADYRRGVGIVPSGTNGKTRRTSSDAISSEARREQGDQKARLIGSELFKTSETMGSSKVSSSGNRESSEYTDIDTRVVSGSSKVSPNLESYRGPEQINGQREEPVWNISEYSNLAERDSNYSKQFIEVMPAPSEELVFRNGEENMDTKRREHMVMTEDDETHYRTGRNHSWEISEFIEASSVHEENPEANDSQRVLEASRTSEGNILMEKPNVDFSTTIENGAEYYWKASQVTETPSKYGSDLRKISSRKVVEDKINLPPVSNALGSGITMTNVSVSWKSGGERKFHSPNKSGKQSKLADPSKRIDVSTTLPPSKSAETRKGTMAAFVRQPHENYDSEEPISHQNAIERDSPVTTSTLLFPLKSGEQGVEIPDETHEHNDKDQTFLHLKDIFDDSEYLSQNLTTHSAQKVNQGFGNMKSDRYYEATDISHLNSSEKTVKRILSQGMNMSLENGESSLKLTGLKGISHEDFSSYSEIINPGETESPKLNGDEEFRVHQGDENESQNDDNYYQRITSVSDNSLNSRKNYNKTMGESTILPKNVNKKTVEQEDTKLVVSFQTDSKMNHSLLMRRINESMHNPTIANENSLKILHRSYTASAKRNNATQNVNRISQDPSSIMNLLAYGRNEGNSQGSDRQGTLQISPDKKSNLSDEFRDSGLRAADSSTNIISKNAVSLPAYSMHKEKKKRRSERPSTSAGDKKLFLNDHETDAKSNSSLSSDETYSNINSEESSNHRESSHKSLMTRLLDLKKERASMFPSRSGVTQSYNGRTINSYSTTVESPLKPTNRSILGAVLAGEINTLASSKNYDESTRPDVGYGGTAIPLDTSSFTQILRPESSAKIAIKFAEGEVRTKSKQDSENSNNKMQWSPYELRPTTYFNATVGNHDEITTKATPRKLESSSSEIALKALNPSHLNVVTQTVMKSFANNPPTYETPSRKISYSNEEVELSVDQIVSINQQTSTEFHSDTIEETEYLRHKPQSIELDEKMKALRLVTDFNVTPETYSDTSQIPSRELVHPSSDLVLKSSKASHNSLMAQSLVGFSANDSPAENTPLRKIQRPNEELNTNKTDSINRTISTKFYPETLESTEHPYNKLQAIRLGGKLNTLRFDQTMSLNRTISTKLYPGTIENSEPPYSKIQSIQVSDKVNAPSSATDFSAASGMQPMLTYAFPTATTKAARQHEPSLSEIVSKASNPYHSSLMSQSILRSFANNAPVFDTPSGRISYPDEDVKLSVDQTVSFNRTTSTKLYPDTIENSEPPHSKIQSIQGSDKVNAPSPATDFSTASGMQPMFTYAFPTATTKAAPQHEHSFSEIVSKASNPYHSRLISQSILRSFANNAPVFDTPSGRMSYPDEDVKLSVDQTVSFNRTTSTKLYPDTIENSDPPYSKIQSIQVSDEVNAPSSATDFSAASGMQPMLTYAFPTATTKAAPQHEPSLSEMVSKASNPYHSRLISQSILRSFANNAPVFDTPSGRISYLDEDLKLSVDQTVSFNRTTSTKLYPDTIENSEPPYSKIQSIQFSDKVNAPSPATDSSTASGMQPMFTYAFPTATTRAAPQHEPSLSEIVSKASNPYHSRLISQSILRSFANNAPVFDTPSGRISYLDEDVKLSVDQTVSFNRTTSTKLYPDTIENSEPPYSKIQSIQFSDKVNAPSPATDSSTASGMQPMFTYAFPTATTRAAPQHEPSLSEIVSKASNPYHSHLMTQSILRSLANNPPPHDTPLRRISYPNEEVEVNFNQTVGFNQTDSDNLTRASTALNQWPVKHSAVVEGDLVLGGLMMVHEREDSVTCGPVMPQGGVQALEAMLYTLDRLNEEGIVPGVKIGAHILDDCDKDTYGLEMAVDFIKGSISNIDGAEYHCNKTAVRKVISGVVGAASSVTSIQVANLLRLFRIPQVSFFSTSPELSNKQRFEYFTRTIPSDHYQVKAMVDIVRKMGWSYVSIIYEESNYGIKAFEELEELLAKYDICIAVKEKLVKDSGVAEETAYDNIVQKLLTKPRARGCIIFGSDQEVAGVMRAVRRCNATGAFSWIGSDGWSARGLVSDGNEPEVEGTLSVQPQANPVKGFEEYFLNLTVENNRRNPWFVEFWEDHFQCRYPNASLTPYNQKYTKPCDTTERLSKLNTAFEGQLQFVSDAVMAFAYAFRDMHKELCKAKPGLCDAMKPTKGTELLKYLRKVDFEGLSGDKFRFDKNGDGPARYNIIHFKQTSPREYKWVRVGEYLEGQLSLNTSEIQFKYGHQQYPESVCSLPCEVGQAKKYVEGESCCWHCFNCTQYQIRHPLDETQCEACPQGTVPDDTHSNCRDIPEEFLKPESGWAIGAMSFSATGILVTLFVGGVFLKHNDTPVVRASGRELSYVLLSGILLCYLVTFALVMRPTDIVCGIQRFAAGFCFTVVYAALLTKTNRIARIFNASKRSAKRPSLISPRSQLIICSGLVGVQILINGVWMVIDPARAMHHYPTREDNLLVCSSYIDASYMIAFSYPILLILVCTVYAVLTRKIPEAFNESKHIGFTMYTTCVIWLAFVPLYFGTGNHVALRITSMSVTISLSASVTIACLFSPKLYIILIRPERNVRQSMMPARHSTTKSTAVTGTNASSMMAAVTLTAATCDQNKAVKRHVTTTMDCSTQSEHYEIELKDGKNGKPPPSLISRATQTLSGGKESNCIGAANDINNKESNGPSAPVKQCTITRIGNGPLGQKDILL